jgi:hypothetical protein
LAEEKFGTRPKPARNGSALDLSEEYMDERALSVIAPALARDVIIVLGMHRAETSTVTGVLARLAPLLESPVLGNDNNPRGYFESDGIWRLHDDLVASTGLRWDDWRRFDASWYKTPAAAVFKRRAIEQFLADFNDQPAVVLNEPRISRFVPFWLDVIDQLGARPHTVISVRSPLEVAQSLKQSEGLSLSTGLLLWLRHTLDSEAATRRVQRSIVSWRNFLSDWRLATEKISRELEIAWADVSDLRANEIDEFLATNPRHDHVEDAAVVCHPDIHEWILKTHRAMLELAQNWRSSTAFDVLDEVRDRFDVACALFGRALLDLEVDFVLRANALQTTLQEQEAALAAAQQEKKQVAAELAAAHYEKEQIAAALTAGNNALEMAHQDASLARSEAHRLRVKLSRAKRRLKSMRSSTSWQASYPLRLMGTILRPPLRLLVRRAVGAVHWATPWKMRARIRRRRKSLTSEHLLDGLRPRIEHSGLFDARTYLELNEDLEKAKADAWSHFLNHGIWEGRRFTTPDIVARALSQSSTEIHAALKTSRRAAAAQSGENAIFAAAAPLSLQRTKIGIFCNSHGNFFMQEIANLVQWQLTALNIDAHLRTEESDPVEHFDLRVFVAPHEFFWLGKGESWKVIANTPGSVLFNVEQMQTPWFCRAFPYLLKAALVLDINFQSAVLLRKAGCHVVHYMPPYLPECSYTSPQLDVSHVELVRGYAFSRSQYNWIEHDGLSDRPIDILFIGSESERRLKAIESLRELTDKYRFVCVYTHQNSPLTSANYRTTSPEINCALAQRSKIVLNIHRDWIGYFEWSRMVMQGFWQGACVISDPSLPDPVFTSDSHFLEENTRHLPDLLHWLLGTPEGQSRMAEVAAAGYERARSPAARAAMLVPMLNSLGDLVGISKAAA